MVQKESTAPRSFLGNIFISPSEPRLRAGWRFLLQAAMQIGLTIALSVAGFGLLIVLGRLPVDLTGLNSMPGLAAGEVVELITVLASVLIARRFLDRRSFVSLGFRLGPRLWGDIGAGIGITFAMMGLIFVAEWALGWLTLTGFAWGSEPAGSLTLNLLIWLIVFVVVGWNEELMSRGYHLQTIASGMGLFWGLMISSAIFGVLHLANPNATWRSAAGILFAGLLLGYAYVRTGQLWLSIGLHIGWNFFEGVVFGFPVSGLPTYQLIKTTIAGPIEWTGGAFGPEAGLIVLPAIFAAVGLVYLYTAARAAHDLPH